MEDISALDDETRKPVVVIKKFTRLYQTLESLWFHALFQGLNFLMLYVIQDLELVLCQRTPLRNLNLSLKFPSLNEFLKIFLTNLHLVLSTI